MTKTKSTKRSLIMSALALFICVSMFIGSTYAWFTDTVTSSGNKIQSGTLKIDLEMLDKDDDTWSSIKDSEKAIFDYQNWEPGYTDVKVLKVENEGTLALKWMAKFVSAFELTALADVIDVYVCPSETELSYPTDRNLDGYVPVGTVRDFVNTIETTTTGKLEAGDSAYLGIALKMQETAGNEYQGMDLGGEFDIMIMATQLTSEEDSFDDQYDKDATYLNKNEAGNYVISTAAELVYFADSVNNGKKTYAGETVKLTADIDLAGITWAPIGQTGATEFKGVFDGQGYTIKNMTVNNTDSSANCASGLFGWIESHGQGITVKNVKFDNANVVGNHNVGVVAGYVYGTIENCVVSNSSVTGINANDDANGDKVGAIVGYVGDSTIKGNKVENCIVKGNRDVGGLAGVVHNGVLSFENNSVTNTTVYYITERSYASAGELFSGRVAYVANSTNTSSGNKVLKLVDDGADLETALKAGKSVALASDVTLEGHLSSSNMGNITIYGGGHTLTIRGIYGVGGKNVTLSDLTLVDNNPADYMIYNQGGKVELTNVTYSGNTNKAFQLAGGGEVVLNNCNISGDVTGTYSASNIWCGDGRTVTVNGGNYGSIFMNVSEGANVLSASKITLNSGTIGKLILETEINKKTGDGKGYKSATLIQNGGTITNLVENPQNYDLTGLTKLN